ncbi:heavy-metal-associated domain-containing protein [Azospira restricta]|uniref:heavy-metal-associated domain-containing protein n=1 Tax=Azospira restricta TaxID=404405 RepID=UPI001EEF81B1|nr:heavy-metal-associated domain-containing protein [Azospira restricta]
MKKAHQNEHQQAAWQFVRRLAPALAIAHHIPGRIRLKLHGGATEIGELPPLDEIRRELEATRGVSAVRVNLLARSCTVEYDAQIIPPTAWNDLLAGTASPAADALVGTLRAQYDAWRDRQD